MKQTPSSNPSPERGAVQGEGDYKAARRYNKATKKFVDSGAVPGAARDAEPRTQDEAPALEDAERVGLEHAKGEDSQIERP